MREFLRSPRGIIIALQQQGFPVMFPVEPKQIHEKLLNALARGFGDVYEKAVIVPANHQALSTDQNPFLLMDFFTLEQLDIEPACFAGLLNPFETVPADTRFVRFVRAADPGIALVIRPEKMG